MRKGTNREGLRKGQRLRVWRLLQLKTGWCPRPGTEPFQEGLRFTFLTKTKDLDSSYWFCHIKASAFSFLTVRSLQVKCFVTENQVQI